MKHPKFLPLLTFMSLTLLSPIPEAFAQQPGFGFRPSRQFQQQRQMLLRQSYRPSVKIVRPAGADRKISAGRTYTYSFNVRKGWVTKIELRSGLKVIKTIPVGQRRSGTGKITISSADLKRAGNKVTLWAWQGQKGFQSIHGESIRYTLN